MAQTTNLTGRQRARGNSKTFALPSPSSSSSSSSVPSPSAPASNARKHAAPPALNLNPNPSTSPDSDSDISDDAPLPFPAALPRSDFLAAEFDAAAYLSSLPHRHETLEDLRADLRERGAGISAELLELVNANYTSFLSLGGGLRGGEDRVEDVRVALLGFRRAVDEVRERVAARAHEVARLNRQRAAVAADIEVGRKMLELDERVAALEDRLAVGSGGARGRGGGQSEDDEEEEEEDEDDEGEMVGGSAAKLGQLARDYVVVEELADAVGREVPFVRKTEERMVRCRNTILLDLSTALKEAKRAGPAGQGKLLRLMGIYALMDAQADAVKVLKSK